MLGYCDDSQRISGVGLLKQTPNRNSAGRPEPKRTQHLHELVAREWSELPYAMMRLTAAGRPWDGNRVYWRDRNVQLGDIDLHLASRRAEDQVPAYAAIYAQDELRRSFMLHPSLDRDQLRWTAPGLSGSAKLSTQQLAEKLLGKLVSFYTTGLS